MAVFDAVVNNADRKIGHLLPVSDGHLYGCDHGVCFGEEYKLRTVLWQWRGRKLPGRALQALARLKAELADRAAGRRAAAAADRGRDRPPPGSGSTCCSRRACTRTRRRTGPRCPGRPI